MNRDLLNYYLGSLANSTTLSPQCLKVRDLLLADDGSDQDRLHHVLEFLTGTEPIEDDTVRWLRCGIRGHYGGEGYVLDISDDEEAAFWEMLRVKYPQNAWLCFVAADAKFFLDTSASLELFIRAIEMEPSLIYKLGGEVWETIQASEQGLRFDMLRLAKAKQSGDRQEWEELY
jgi:hypothetical protein